MKYLTATYQQFISLYPQFANADYQSNYYYDDTYAWAIDNWDINAFRSRINTAIYLMTAHRLILVYNAKNNQAGQGGKVASATVGSVSASFESIPNQTKFDYWLSLSPYGLDLLGLLATLTACPKYIGGSITRVF